MILGTGRNEVSVFGSGGTRGVCRWVSCGGCADSNSATCSCSGGNGDTNY